MIEDVKVPSIDGATRAIRALSTCQNFNPEHDVYANMCYITAESTIRNLWALSYRDLINCQSASSDLIERDKYKRFINALYDVIADNPNKEVGSHQTQYYLSYLFLVSPSLACRNIPIDSKRLKNNGAAYWGDGKGSFKYYNSKNEDIYWNDLSDNTNQFEVFRYFIGSVPLIYEFFPDDEKLRDFYPNENPLILKDGILTDLYFSQKNIGQSHPESLRVSYFLCFLKAYKNPDFSDDARKFFNNIVTQTKDDLNIPKFCKAD